MKLEKVSSTIYHLDPARKTYYFNISLKFDDDEVHIAAVTARPSKYDASQWVIYMPSYNNGKRYKQYIELRKTSKLKVMIEAECLLAIEAYTPPP